MSSSSACDESPASQALQQPQPRRANSILQKMVVRARVSSLNSAVSAAAATALAATVAAAPAAASSAAAPAAAAAAAVRGAPSPRGRDRSARGHQRLSPELIARGYSGGSGGGGAYTGGQLTEGSGSARTAHDRSRKSRSRSF
ncbi:unnamed protein product [Laminaria digitata]